MIIQSKIYNSFMRNSMDVYCVVEEEVVKLSNFTINRYCNWFRDKIVIDLEVLLFTRCCPVVRKQV